MKRIICTFLVIVMMLSLAACGKKVEPPMETIPPVETTVATEPVEEPTEEPTEIPTEPAREAPTDFESVAPATYPEPMSVDEILENSEDTQTVSFETIEEYEDLLWEMGFKEVRLAGTHMVYNKTASCVPIALTYNSEVFRLDFSYSLTENNGETQVQENWMMCGMKAQVRGNITNLDMVEYVPAQQLNMFTVTLPEGADIGSLDIGDIMTNGTADTTTIITPNFESELLNYTAKSNPASVNVSVVYYPRTGSLYNYMQRPIGTGSTTTTLNSGDYASVGKSSLYGLMAQYMCFHYVFPETEN